MSELPLGFVPTPPKDDSLNAVIKAHVQNVFAKYGKNLTLISKILKVSKGTVYRLIKKYNINKDAL